MKMLLQLILPALVMFAGLVAGFSFWLQSFFGENRSAVQASAVAMGSKPWKAGDAVWILFVVVLQAVSIMLSAESDAAVQSDPPSFWSLALSSLPMIMFVLLICLVRASASGITVCELLGINYSTLRADTALGIVGGLAITVPALLLAFAGAWFMQLLGCPVEQQSALLWLSNPDVSFSVRGMLKVQAVVMAPLLEEILYRAIILAVLLRIRRIIPAVFLVSVLFALLHLHLHLIPALFFVGASCALVMLRSGTLTSAIVMHATFNAVNLVLMV